MATYIALLRGINVGGKHSLPMKQLVQAMEAIGLKPFGEGSRILKEKFGDKRWFK